MVDKKDKGDFQYMRKRQLIYKKQQLRFSMFVVVLAWFFHIYVLGLALSPLYGPILIGEDAEEVQPILWYFVVFCFEHWWIVLISLGYIGCCALLVSHLIFGPIRRFETVLVQKKENPAEPVRCSLRRADFFQDFSQLLEEVLNGLGAKEGPAQVEQGKGAGAGKSTDSESN